MPPKVKGRMMKDLERRKDYQDTAFDCVILSSAPPSGFTHTSEHEVPYAQIRPSLMTECTTNRIKYLVIR